MANAVEVIDLREIEKDMTVKSVLDGAVDVLAWSEAEQRARLAEILEIATALVAVQNIAVRLQGGRA